MVTTERILDDAIGVLATTKWCQEEGNPERIEETNDLTGVSTCLLGDIFIACRLNGLSISMFDEDGHPFGMYPTDDSPIQQRQAVELASEIIRAWTPEDEEFEIDHAGVCWRYNDNVAQSKDDVIGVLEKARALAAERGL